MVSSPAEKVRLVLEAAETEHEFPLTLNVVRALWLELQTFGGKAVPDVDGRIEALIALWEAPIGSGWQRGVDARICGPDRYTRSDALKPHLGEHAIEAAVLAEPLTALEYEGGRVLDGVNAVPLTKDVIFGGKVDNVEADIFLLIDEPGGKQTVSIVEVKSGSNNAWFAAVENLLQLRLAGQSIEAQRVFLRRPIGPSVSRQALRQRGMVLAPLDFYEHKGQKANAVDPARKLLFEVLQRLGVEVELAVWDGDGERRAIRRCVAADS
jgi:hypothetical protein